ncbi:MAG: nickel pincer cofactor biosynthesis protein LarB [Thermoplasmata archaeon]
MKYSKEELKILLDRYIKEENNREFITETIFKEYMDIKNRLKLDPLRPIRAGIPEIIYAERKEISDLELVVNTPFSSGIIFTRCTDKQLYHFSKKKNFNIYNSARVITYNVSTTLKYGPIGIITAGNADIPIGEETRIVSNALGIKTLYSYDVGIADLFRIIETLEEMKEAKLLVVIAGMEGALPSIVASLTPQPIIAVPTSIGYGIHKSGETTLNAMLNSCTSILTVNIDGGTVAALNALKILKMST